MSRGPRSSRRSQPLMLRPTSMTTVPSRGRVDGGGRERLDAAHANSGCLDQPIAVVVESAGGDDDRRPRPIRRRRSRKSTACPSMRSARVMRLGRDCHAASVTTRTAPGVDREEQRGLVAEAVGAPLEPVPPAEPAVAQQHLDAVRARSEQRGDVVREDLQALAVRREAGDELVVADPDAVEEHLDEAVRRDRQGRRLGRDSQREVRAELVGGPVPGIRDLGLVRPDPARCQRRPRRSRGQLLAR